MDLAALLVVAKALQARNAEYLARWSNAARTVESDPERAYSELTWAEGELKALTLERQRFKDGMREQAVLLGRVATGQDVENSQSADMAVDEGALIQSGKARALILMGRWKEAQGVLDQALAEQAIGSRANAKRQLLVTYTNLLSFVQSSVGAGEPGLTGSGSGETLASIAAKQVALEDWQGAIQTKSLEGTFALNRGRSDLFEKLYEEACSLAEAHGLRYQELKLRITQASALVNTFSSGKMIDTVLRDAGSNRGELARSVTRYSDEALSVCGVIARQLDAGTVPKSPAVISAAGAAKEAARAFDCAEIAQELVSWLNQDSAQPIAFAKLETLREINNALGAQLQQRRDELMSEMWLLRAELHRVFEDNDSQLEALNKGLEIAPNLPDLQCRLYMALADAYTARAHSQNPLRPNGGTNNLGQAQTAAEKAVAANPKSQAARAKLNEIRQLKESGIPLSTSSESMWWTGETANNFGKTIFSGNAEEVLPILDQVISGGGLQARQALMVRAAAYYMLHRYEDAVRDLDDRIKQLEQEINADADPLAFGFEKRLEQLEVDCSLKACALTQLGRQTEAWEATERGRSFSLQRVVTHSVEQAETSFEVWRHWMARERAAFLSFSLNRWGTLVICAGPDDREPSAELILSSLSADLTKESARQTDEDSPVWTDIIFNAVPGVSKKLLLPIEAAVRKITAQAEVLYILPDSYLFRLPFSALTLSDGSYLGDLCPLAIAPSAAFVLWNAAGRSAPARTCLAVGVGEVPWNESVIRFADQAKEAASCWVEPRECSLKLDGEATADVVGKAASLYDALHFSCHGSTSSEVFDPLAASQLALADRKVSAREALSWTLKADLVFLNVCQGGRYRMEGFTEINGFLRALHSAGARSVISSVTHVEPTAAGCLAEQFYRHWLGGETKARALQRAQQDVRKTYPEAKHWASHGLSGDYR